MRLQQKGIYYREIGEANILRRINKRARQNKPKNQLALVCEYFEAELKRSIYYTRPDLIPVNYMPKQKLSRNFILSKVFIQAQRV